MGWQESSALRPRGKEAQESCVQSVDGSEHALLVHVHLQRRADHALSLAPHILCPRPEGASSAAVLCLGWLPRPDCPKQLLLFGREQLLGIAIAVGAPPSQPPEELVDY